MHLGQGFFEQAEIQIGHSCLCIIVDFNYPHAKYDLLYCLRLGDHD